VNICSSLAVGLDPIGYHCLGTAADQVACGAVRQWRQTFTRENHVKGLDEVRRCINQGAVEVKDNREYNHEGDR
jgi:hypothetical protein